MSTRLPERIEPLALIDKGRQITGELPLAKFEKLEGLVLTRDGEVSFELHFGKEGNVAAVRGRVKADLALECQICLTPLAWRVDSDVRLAVVKSLDEADRLPEDFEPLLLESEVIVLADIVQEELLLSLPVVPQHTQCEPAGRYESGAEGSPAAPKRNPFAVLTDLKTK